MHISNLGIDSATTNACIEGGIVEVEKLFSYAQEDLVERLKISSSDVDNLLDKASSCLIENRCSFLHDKSIQKNFKLGTGCGEIDNILDGGIWYPGITEISGESASGKTQLCMQLCLMSKFPNGQIPGGSLYICTEDVFPTKRLHQMASKFYIKNKNELGLKNLCDVTDDIFIEHVTDMEELWSLFDVRIASLLLKHHIKLVVIDSVAALFRAEFDVQDSIERAKSLARLGQILQSLSYLHQLCVVCVNQVSDVFDGTSTNSDGTRNVAPALGLTWAYAINTRIMLSRTKWKMDHKRLEDNDSAASKQSSIVRNVRKLKLVFSPCVVEGECYFTVDEDGVKGVRPENNPK